MQEYSNNLYLHNTVWYSKTRSSVFYPESGNEIYCTIEENSFWYKHRNDCIAITCKNFMDQQIPIFEIGGGNGFVSQRLLNDGFDVILLEPDEIGIQNAQKRGLKKVICSSFQDADFKADSILNIGLFDVLEHIQDDLSFLKELYRVQKEGSRLIVTVPAYSFLWSEEDLHDGHFRRYTKKTLQSKCREAGFRPIYSTYFFSLLPFPIFILRAIPSIFKIKREFTKDAYLKENKTDNTLLNKIMDILWNFECKWIQRKHKLSFGGSILLVVEKNKNL